MILTIDRHVGVGPIRFGASRQEVREALGRRVEAGKRHETDPGFDACDELGILIHYDESDRCTAIEIGQDGRVVYDGFGLFDHPAHEVRAWALARDPDLDPTNGFVSRALGLAMSATHIDEEDLEEEERNEPATSFLVFEPGYYEREWDRIARTRGAGGLG